MDLNNFLQEIEIGKDMIRVRVCTSDDETITGALDGLERGEIVRHGDGSEDLHRDRWRSSERRKTERERESEEVKWLL